jgi:hypothetical protein
MERVTTTFWSDFDIADRFGIDAIKDTFNRAFNEWKVDYRYLTELVMTLNHKCWSYYETNDAYCELYAELFHKADDYAIDNLKGDKLKFYLEVTD